MIHPSNKFLNFTNILQQITIPPRDEMAVQISTLPKAGTLPEPAATWLFFNLMLYSARQQWAREQLQQHLPGLFANGEDLKQHEGERIPGMPEWQLREVVGHLVAIGHRGTQERIGFSLHPEPKDLIDDLTAGHSESPWDIPGRLAAAAQGRELPAAAEELVRARVLRETDVDGDAFENFHTHHYHRLSKGAHGLSSSVSRFCQLWKDPSNRLWLAAAIGDWPSADELAQSHGDTAVKLAVAKKFEAYRQRRLAIAHFNLSLEPDSVDDLAVLFREGLDDFNVHVERAIKTAGVNVALVDLLAKTGDPQWNDYLFAAFTQEARRAAPYWPLRLLEPAERLLERGYRVDDVLATLAKQGKDLDRAALMFLKYAPLQALPVIRRALRHEHTRDFSSMPPGVPYEMWEEGYETVQMLSNEDRRGLGAILSIIDRPWAAKELLDATSDLWKERHDPAEIVSLILALRESNDPTTRAAGEQWLATIGDYEDLERETAEFRLVRHALYDEAVVLQGVSVEAGHK